MSSSLSRIGLSLEMAAILECRLENQPDCCQPRYHGLLSTMVPWIVVNQLKSMQRCTVHSVNGGGEVSLRIVEVEHSGGGQEVRWRIGDMGWRRRNFP